MSYRNWLKEKRKKRDFLTSKEKNDTHDYNWKDDQGQAQNEEKNYEPDLVKETPGTDKIEEVARFVADNFYNGQYTIEKHSTDCYQFCFGVGDTSSEHAEGKTVREAKGRAVVLEMPSGREDIKSHKKIIKLAADRLAMIQDERRKSEKLADKLHAKERECQDLVLLADGHLASINEERQKKEELETNFIAREDEYRKTIREKDDEIEAKEKESKDLTSLANDRLAAINEEKQKNEEMKANFVIMQREYAKKINEKDDKIVAGDVQYRKLMKECEDLVSLAKDRMVIIQKEKQEIKKLGDELKAKKKKYDELTMKYIDSEAFISEQAGTIEDNKEKIKELQDNIAAKDLESAALTKEKEKNKAYARMQENIVEKLQNRVRAREDENVVLTKKKEKLEQERAEIMQVISKFSDSWKDDDVMQSFGEKIATKKEKLPDIVDLILKFIEEVKYQLRDLPPIEETKEEKVFATIKGVKILEPVWDDIQDTVIDGKWHTFSEAGEIIGWHEDHKLTPGQVKERRKAYFRFARDEEYVIDRGEKNYRYEWKTINGVNNFRFILVEKPEPEEGKIAEPEKQVQVEEEEKEPLELGPRINIISKHSIFKNPYERFETRFCDDESHHYLKVVKMLKKYDRYNQYEEKTLGKVARYYIKHASNFYWISEKTGYGIFKTAGKKSEIERKKVEEAVPEIGEEKYKPLGNAITDFVAKKVRKDYPGIEGLYTNPVNDVLRVLNESDATSFDEAQIHKHVRGVFENFKELIGSPSVLVDAYIRYIEIYHNQLIEKTGEGKDVRYDIIESKTSPREKVKEKIEKKKTLEKKKEFRPVRDKYGERLYNKTTEKVRESYHTATFHKKPVKELSQELNESAKTIMSSMELREFFRGILEKTYTYVSATRCNYYIKYFRITKMLKYVRDKEGRRYEIHRDTLIPKKKNKMRILEKIGMKGYARDSKVEMS